MHPHTALITGVTSGIGLELARIARTEGYRLVLVGRDPRALDRVVTELQATGEAPILSIVADLADPLAIQTIRQQTDSKHIVPDVLINNAGFGDLTDFVQADPTKLQSMIMVNVWSLTMLTKQYLPAMIARGTGRILQLGSTAAFVPGPGMAVYFATKAYVLSLSEALQEELRGTGVSLTVLCPWPTASSFQDRAKMANSPLIRGKKLPTAREVAVYGWQAMQRGRRIAIHGLRNKLLVFSGRVTPRSWVARIAGWLNRGGGH